MTTTKPSRIQLDDPSELIESIPYLIGFHPTESLVILGFAPQPGGSGRRQIQVGLRIDLPARSGTPADFISLADALMRSGARDAVIVIVTDSPGGAVYDERWAQLTAAVEGALSSAGIGVMDELLAGPDRWWSLACDNESCCPCEGTPRSLQSSIAAAEATVAGMVALPDRDAVGRTIAPLPGEIRARAEPHLAHAEDRVHTAVLKNGLRRIRESDLRALQSEIERRDTQGDGQRSLTEKRLARFAVALTDKVIRDEIWSAIDRRKMDPGDLLREMATRLPAPYDAPPLFLYAWAQWRHGKGTLASIAAERAIASDPGYSAARLLLYALQCGLDPRTTPPMGQNLR